MWYPTADQPWRHIYGGRTSGVVAVDAVPLAARWFSGSAKQFDAIRRYSIAFLERHVAGRSERGRLLDVREPMLTRRLAAGEAPKASGRRERQLRGTLDRTMRHEGIERTYRLYVPRKFDPGKPDPLVIALHGGFGTGKGMEKLSAGGFNALTDRHGFVVAYPDGIERHWNDGRTGVLYLAHREKVDDVGFIGALMDALVKEFGLDPGRVYVIGASNGAMMCYRLALEMPTRIAAIAPVMCPLQTEYAAAAVSEKVPVLLIHGTDDPLAPFGGGPISSGTRKIGEVLSVEQTVRFWVDRNHARKPGR